MREQKTRAQLKKLWDNTHTVLWIIHPHFTYPTIPSPSPPPSPPVPHQSQWQRNGHRIPGTNETIYQMWKCKKWWNIQLKLGIWFHPLSQHHLPPARNQPRLLIPYAWTINSEKAKNPEMRLNSQQIVSYCLVVYVQRPSDKRGRVGTQL